MWREEGTEARRGRGRRREFQADGRSSRKPDWGLDLRTLRSWPKLQSRVGCLTNFATNPCVPWTAVLRGTKLSVKNEGLMLYLQVFFFFFLRFYLFIHERHRERGRDTGRGRSRLHAGSLMWDSIPGLQGSCPEPKADAQPLSHPGVPGFIFSWSVTSPTQCGQPLLEFRVWGSFLSLYCW